MRIHPSTIQLLRFPFSLFLLPVFLFAISQAPEVDNWKALMLFFLLHFLLYPASNGYNSFMDRDQSPIGGLANPMQPTRQLFYVTIILDVLSLLLSLFISVGTMAGILLYILASRAYSYRGIRLKRYPIIGFLTVFIFQGALVFFITYQAVSGQIPSLLPCIISSLLIGALYPLTQVYQHEADRADGVTTISMLMGKRGSFLLSGVQFAAATFLFFLMFRERSEANHFVLFLLCTLPVVTYFLYWMRHVWLDAQAANFKNSFLMNLISTAATTVFFITLILQKH